MQISKEDLEMIRKSGESLFLNELKSFYLLGDTNEYDKFEPSKLNLNAASDFDKYKYACCSYAGFKIDENEERAFRIWLDLANSGQVESMLESSVFFFKTNDSEEGFKMLQKCANAGNQIAQFRIALCYMFGFGTTQNQEKAMKIFEKLSMSNYPNAVYMLGSFYYNGDDKIVPRDQNKGWELIKKACKLGSPFAEYEVAIQLCAHKEDHSFTPDVIALLEKSANGGDLRALYLLSLAYAKGEGVEIDLEKSMNYLAQSYEGEFPLAIDLMEKLRKSIRE